MLHYAGITTYNIPISLTSPHTIRKELKDTHRAFDHIAIRAPRYANPIEGLVDQLNATDRTVTVQGINFYTIADTDYDDGLNRFEDLRVGQRVDFDYRGGRHIATEIELED